jgi:bifunctional glutamyl/prolyl-tRNA synthetase
MRSRAAARDAMGAKSLCIPFAQVPFASGTVAVCIHPACGKPATRRTLFGRSY